MEGIMYYFEENKMVKHVEYPQLQRSHSGVITMQPGLQPTFFMSSERML
jgi:hypothetical protein